MNKRRQALRKQNIKTAKQKLQFGNGEKRRSSAIDFTNPLDVGRVMAQNKAAIDNFKNMDVKMTNPWARENSIINTVGNNLSNVSNIDPAVLINRPSAKPEAPNKPQGKPTKNPTLGFTAGTDPNRPGVNLGVGFNTNKGGKGFNTSVQTNVGGGGGSVLENSSITFTPNRVPINASIRGDGTVSVSGNVALKNLFGKNKNKNPENNSGGGNNSRKKKNKKN